MQSAGGLIKLHYHDNKTVLDKFSDISGILYYNDESLFLNLELSKAEHNKITKNDDGLFVDGSFIDRFAFKDGELLFDDIVISRNYDEDQEKINKAIKELWAENPFKDITVDKTKVTTEVRNPLEDKEEESNSESETKASETETTEETTETTIEEPKESSKTETP